MKRGKFTAFAALLASVMVAGLLLSACAIRSDNLEELVSSVRDMGAPKAAAARGIMPRLMWFPKTTARTPPRLPDRTRRSISSI